MAFDRLTRPRPWRGCMAPPVGRRTFLRATARGGLGAGAAILLAACGGRSGQSQAASGTAAKPGTGGILRIAMSAGNIPFPTTPPNEGFEGRRFVGYQIYDGLYRWNVEQGDQIPTPQLALAEAVEMLDEITWIFHLRRGVKFHDGTPFTAESVVFHFDRVSKKDSPHFDELLAPLNASNFRYIGSYAAVDAYTVKIITKGPYAFLPDDLTFINFASPTAVERYGNKEYNQHASGTGPFIMTKYIDGQVMELTANQEYWRGRPRLDKIILYPQPEAASRLAALQSGDVDWAEVPPPDSVEQLRTQKYQVFLKPYPHGIMPQFNLYRPPFTDQRLRLALNYAADREGLAKLINNCGYPASQYYYKEHPFHDPTFEGYKYDPARAKALLAEAGYQPGSLRLKFAYTTGGSGNMWPGPMMEKIQSDFKAIGVETELIPMEWNTLISIFYDGLNHQKWRHLDIRWASPGPVARTSLNVFLSKQPSGAPNSQGYGNPAVDDLYTRAARTFDPEQQTRLLREMQGAVVRDAPFIAWMHDLNLRVLSPKVRGYVHPQSWFVDLTQVWMER